MKYLNTFLCRLKGLAFYLLFLFVFFFKLSFSEDSQRILVLPSGDTVVIKAIPILEINAQLEEVNNTLNKYPEIIKPNKDVVRLDSTLDQARALLDKEEKRITEEGESVTLRNIDDYKKQWEGYDEVLDKWKAILSNRIEELEEYYYAATRIHDTWEETEKAARKENVVNESLDRIKEVITHVNEIKKTLKTRRDSTLLYQNQVTDFQIRVNQILLVLKSKRGELQSLYFIQDSPALWQASDSTAKLSRVKDQFKSALRDNYKQIGIFLDVNQGKWIFHIILFIALLVLLLALHKTFKIPENGEENPKIINTLIVLQYFPASAMFLALVSSIFIYSGFPTSVREFMQILMLFPAIILLRKLVDKKLLPVIISLIVLFLIDEFQFFFIGKTLFSRILLLIEDVFLLWLIVKFTSRHSDVLGAARESTQKAIRNFKVIYLFFIVLTLVANIFGYVNLATLVNNTVIASILIAVLLGVLVIITDSLFLSLFASGFFKNSYIFKYNSEKILKNLHQIFKFLAYYLWVRSVLTSIGVAEQVSQWFSGIFSYTWEFNSVSISFGGIIAFFITIFITVIVTKLVRVILEEEIFPRVKMSRGVPGAISMMVRYILIAFGIYVAITAAGIDLSKFGLIAGALGVGIGFGLQGVVYNFIAGLILAFERPIQKGDTIEVGNLMGDVLGIGVRASTIRTYDGSEVIVPNGNLISTEVINWTLSDRRRRSTIPVNVAYGSKPRDVLKIIAKVAEDHPEVLDFPKPWPLFDGFGDSSLNFRVLFWVDFDRRLSVTSEIAVNIYDALEDAGIHIPFPQQDLHIKSFDPTVQEIIFPGKKDPGKVSPLNKNKADDQDPEKK